MTSRLILGDLHARRKHVATVLHRAGVMDVHGNRLPGVHVTSLGDMVSLGYDEPEADFLAWVDKFIDTRLVGNHEAYPLCPHPDLSFVGFDGEPYRNFKGEEVFPGEADKAAVAIVRRWQDEGRYQVADSVGPWLLTHAGLRPALQKFYREHDACLADVVDDLNRRWRQCVSQPGINDPFITDGSQARGGILWQRFQHLRGGYHATKHMPQIVGHSSDCGPDLSRPNLWCIDSEGGCVGLLTHDDGQTFQLIVSLPDDSRIPQHVGRKNWPPNLDKSYSLR